MDLRTRNIAITALVTVAVVGAVWWTRVSERVPADRLEVAGDVRAQTYVVAAPSITYPTPDYSVGIPTAASTPSSGPKGPASPPQAKSARSQTPVVSGALVQVPVRQGDHVVAGDVVAVLDDAMLDLGVKQAEAAARRARTDVSLIDSNLDTVASNQDKLSSAKRKISTGSAKLADTRATLVATRAKLVGARKKALSGKAALEAQIASLEKLAGGGGTPPTSTPGPTPAQLLASLKGKLAELETGIAKLDAGIKKIDAGLRKLDAAEMQLKSARSKLATGASALSDAKTQLNTARDVLGVVADARSIGVQAAEAQRAAANIIAPVDGVVTFARPAGGVAMVGAPLVRISPDDHALVDTFLVDEQLSRIRIGSKAEAIADSLPDEVAEGHVAIIGSSYVFPPTNFPTDIVHMTRAVKVTVAFDSATHIPPGTPVDLTIYTTNAR